MIARLSLEGTSGLISAGGVIELELEFEAQLPGVISRTGFVDGFHLVGQWFPKIAVFSFANCLLVGFQGIKSIIDLIDAQNSALVADQEAANAKFNFLIDLMTVQRSLGRFFLFEPDKDRQAFMDRLDAFMVAKGFGG